MTRNSLLTAAFGLLFGMIVTGTTLIDNALDKQLAEMENMALRLDAMEQDVKRLRTPVQPVYITIEPKDELKPEPEPEPEEPVEEIILTELGTFRLTAYCPCSKCCGKWAGGPTASGAYAQSEHTIAVDPSVIPLGSTVIINGREYVAEDTGSGVDGNSIDIYFDTHQEALNFGLQYADVQLKTIIEKEK